MRSAHGWLRAVAEDAGERPAGEFGQEVTPWKKPRTRGQQPVDAKDHAVVMELCESTATP
jgi:hypothetical protein